MREHGTRAKYSIDKCRCEPCTLANRLYARERERRLARIRYGIEVAEPTYIDAEEARQQILWLSSVGIGRRRIHEVSGVALTSIQKIASGELRRIRPITAERILAVHKGAALPGSWTDAKETWRLIDEMVAHGIPKRQIALGIGQQGPGLQVGRRKVRRSTEAKVRAFYELRMVEVLTARAMEAERQADYRRRLAAGEVVRRNRGSRAA